MKVTSIAVLFGCSALGVCQSGFPITTDRPSFSDGTLIMPKGRWQIETGYTFADVDGARFETFGEVLLRFPFSDSVELRVSNLSFGRASGTATRVDGLLDPILGMKYKFQNGVTGKSPDLALVVQTTVPAGDKAFRVDRYQPTAKLAWYLQTDALTGVGSNILVSDIGLDSARFSQWAASFYIARTLNPKTAAFAEVYRVMPLSDGGRDGTFVDSGVTYLVNQSTQIDFRLGTGFDRKRDGWFAGAGIAWRF